MEKYLQILSDSLIAKNKILLELIQESEHQASIVKEDVVDWNAFDESVEKKGALIEKLNQFDDGFEALYNRIREGLNQDRSKYKDQIVEIQKLITQVTESSSTLMATEERNKELVTNRFTVEKKRYKQQRVSSKAANNYYASMNKINYIDPQLMDKKK